MIFLLKTITKTRKFETTKNKYHFVFNSFVLSWQKAF